MAESTGLKRKTLDEILKETDKLKQQKQSQTTTAPAAEPVIEFDTQNNTFFKILASDKSKDEKLAEFTKAMTYDETKTGKENLAIQDELVEFMAYLQKKRVALSRKMLTLEDPESIALLTEMFSKMNGGINEYEKKMKPLDDILTAYFNLRNSADGNIQSEIAGEIDSDKEAEVKKLENIAQDEKALKEMQVAIAAAKREKEELEKKAKKKKFWLFGETSPEAVAALDEKIVELDNAAKALEQKQADLQALKDAPAAVSQFGDKYAAEKEIVRQALSKPLDQHVKDTQAMIDSLITFIDDSCSGGDRVLEKLEAQEGRIKLQDEEHRKLSKITQMVARASATAAEKNQEIAKKYSDESAPADELDADRADRRDKLRDIVTYVNTANDTAADTVQTMDSLSKEGLSLMTLQNNVSNLKRKVNKQTTIGIASVASNMSASVSNFSNAVANETAETMAGAAEKMDEKTSLQNQSQAIQQANQYSEQAQKLQRDIEKSRQNFQVLETIKDISQEGMSNLKEQLAEMRNLVEQTNEAFSEVRSVGTNLDMQDSKGALAAEFDKNATKPATNDNAAAAPVSKPAAPKAPKASDALPDF